MLVLSDLDVAGLVSMGEAIGAVEGAFGELQRGMARMPTRSTIMIPRHGGSISFMSSYLEESGVEAAKIISIYPGNPKRGLPTTAAWVVVNDPEGRVRTHYILIEYLCDYVSGESTPRRTHRRRGGSSSPTWAGST